MGGAFPDLIVFNSFPYNFPLMKISAKPSTGTKVMNTERYIQRLREDMELRRFAESTQGNYERAIRLFLKHAGRRVEELNKRNVRVYSLSLVKQELAGEHVQRAPGGDSRYAKQGNELSADATGQEGKNAAGDTVERRGIPASGAMR